MRRPLKTLVHADFAGVVELAQLVSSDKRLTPLRLLPLSERVTLTLSAPPHLRFVPPPDVAFGRDAARPTRLTQTSVRMLLRAGMPEPGRLGSTFFFFGGGTNFGAAAGAGAGASPSAAAASGGTAPTLPLFHGIGSTGACPS